METASTHNPSLFLSSEAEKPSGRFNLRLPRTLHGELIAEAEAEGVSLNQYVVTLLARRDAFARVERLLQERKDPTMLVAQSPVWSPGLYRAKDQVIAWKPSTWEAEIGPDWSPVLRDLHEACAGDGGGLRRATVAEFGRSDPFRLLIATMIWGFGRVGYGPWRTRQMLETRGVGTILADIVDTVRSQGAAAGYRRLWDERTGEKSRVPFVGVAFGTKLLYFAGMDHNLSPRPLIYDRNVYRKLSSFDLGLSWVVPFRSFYAEQYEQYCRWAEDKAKEYEVEPDDVEYALFR